MQRSEPSHSPCPSHFTGLSHLITCTINTDSRVLNRHRGSSSLEPELQHSHPFPSTAFENKSPKMSSHINFPGQSKTENMNELSYLHRNISAKFFHATTSHHSYDITRKSRTALHVAIPLDNEVFSVSSQ